MRRPGRATGAAALLVAATSVLAGCKESSGPAHVEIDHFLTITELVGGDPVVVVAFRDCEARPPLRIFANDLEVTRLEQFDPLIFPELDDDMLRLTTSIPSSVLDPSLFGLPVTFQVSASLGCGDRVITTEPVPMRYVPTLAALHTAVEPRRFWPSDVPGELLVCDGLSLVHLSADGELARLALTFPCAAAEVEGRVGERRYLIADEGGVAALDPGPTVTWSRALRVLDSWTDPVRDPVAIYESGPQKLLVVLDPATGTDRVGPLPLARVPRNVGRNLADDILVLETERDGLAPSLTYFVRRFDAAGVEQDLREAVRYEWGAPAYYAEFSLDGTALYYTAAPTGEHSRWIARMDVATGLEVALTRPEDGLVSVLGEAYGRLLVASSEQFVWLSPSTGATLSERFGPDSGTSFLRLRIEEDGSTVLLGEPSGGGAPAARGLYVFAPDGTSIMRFSTPAALFRWLTHDWVGGSLLGYFDEVQVLPLAADYASSL